MSYGNLLEEINQLPIIVKEKIISFYILNYLKENSIKECINSLYSSNGFKEFDLICLYFDKIDKHGYLQITYRDLLFIYQKFNYILLNNLCKTSCKTMIDECWKALQFYFNELKILPGKPLDHNIIKAGGFFTDYIAKNVFSNEFMSYFDYFNKNKDIDLYYYNPRASKKQEYDNYYVQIKNYAKINLISVKNRYTVSAVDNFDFNCCTYISNFNLKY